MKKADYILLFFLIYTFLISISCYDPCGTFSSDCCEPKVRDENGQCCEYPDACGICDGNNLNENPFGLCDCEIDGDVFADCSGECGGNKILDCNYECDGDAVIDACGICDGNNLNENPFGLCDCEIYGNVFADCLGVCGGNAIKDCAGECGGSATKDCAGECGGEDLYCIDCAGILYGQNEIDECGTCDDDVTNDCVMDCAGIWGGSAIKDCAGECGGSATEDCTGQCCICSTIFITDVIEGCDLPTSTTKAYLMYKDGKIIYNSPQAIAGYQFILDQGTSTSNITFFGGDGASAGFEVLTQYNTVDGYLVLAFSLAGGNIPAGCGTLTEFTVHSNETITSISNPILGNTTSTSIMTEIYCSNN